MELIREHKEVVILYATGLFLLIVSFFIDHSFFNYIEANQSPILVYILEWTAYGLLLAFILLIITSIVMWEERKKDWIIPSWVAFVGVLTITLLLKIIVARERPIEAITTGLSQYSFPGTDIAICFSMIAIINKAYPKLKWLWIIFTILIVISKLYLGMHYLSDAVAGALIGFTIGIGIVHIKKKYNLFGASV